MTPNAVARIMLVSLLLGVGHAAAEGLAIFMAQDGSDTNGGLSRQAPIRTFDAAQKVVRATDPKVLTEGVTIYVKPGRYDRTSTVWRAVAPNMHVTIRPYPSAAAGQVVFDGSRGASREFFKFDPADAEDPEQASSLRFTFQDIVVRNFCEGISLGDMTGKHLSGGHLVRGVTFRNIGSKFDPRRRKSAGGKLLPTGNCVAGIRLAATGDTRIINSQFLNIENLRASGTYYRKYGPRLLHAIYISTKSVGTQIVNNTFSGFTGSPIRIRDRSDGTVVEGNTFASLQPREPISNDPPISAVSEWTCNASVPECIDKARAGQPECPSRNTKVGTNRISSELQLYVDASKNETPTCAMRIR